MQQICHVDNSIKDGRPFVRTNVEGTFNLLECARQNPNLKKFIHISTDEVYGDMDDISKDVVADEEFPLVASSYYFFRSFWLEVIFTPMECLL